MTLHTQAKLRLTDANARAAAIERLATYLPLEVAGYECTTESVLDVLIKAAATQQTIECVCNDLDEVVSSEAIRGHLNERIRVDDLHELERRVNQALVAGLPRRLWKPRLRIAIDLHDEPFYGHTPKLFAYACRGPSQKGHYPFLPPVNSPCHLQGYARDLSHALCPSRGQVTRISRCFR